MTTAAHIFADLFLDAIVVHVTFHISTDIVELECTNQLTSVHPKCMLVCSYRLQAGTYLGMGLIRWSH